MSVATGRDVLSAARHYFHEGRCSGHAQFNGRHCRDAAGWERWCIHCAGFMLLTREAETLALWREQDSVLQQIAALVNDEHVTNPVGVLRAVENALPAPRRGDGDPQPPGPVHPGNTTPS